MRVRTLAVAIFGVGTCLAGAQVTQLPGGYKFRLKLSAGERLNFRIPFTIDGLGDKPMSLHFGMRLTVLKVSHGKATVKVGKLDTGGFKLPQLGGAGGNFVVDKRGRVETEGRMMAGFCIQYPDEPVPMGGTFTAPVTVTSGGSLSGPVQQSQATFKLIGIEGSGKTRAARLTFKVAGNRAPSGSILVRLSDGVIDKYYTKFSASMSQVDHPMTVSATVIRY